MQISEGIILFVINLQRWVQKNRIDWYLIAFGLSWKLQQVSDSVWQVTKKPGGIFILINKADSLDISLHTVGSPFIFPRFLLLLPSSTHLVTHIILSLFFFFQSCLHFIFFPPLPFPKFRLVLSLSLSFVFFYSLNFSSQLYIMKSLSFYFHFFTNSFLFFFQYLPPNLFFTSSVTLPTFPYFIPLRFSVNVFSYDPIIYSFVFYFFHLLSPSYFYSLYTP